MKPIRLEITGLNSYTDKQIIDFEKLTERGLFGIFGNTGSGKSSILDAITIAMYGNISRNTKEYINSNCDKAVISYTFEIGSKNVRRKYKVDRTIARNKSDKKGIKTTHSRLIEIYNDEKENVIADKVGEVNKKISEIIGLTSEDFTRSVVLPQGKFNDFLKLTGSDRRDMLERIFNLEKYGRSLIEKVKIRKNKQIRELRDLEIKLSQYDGISEEVYENSLKELEEIKEKEKIQNVLLDSLQAKHDESKQVYENQVTLEKYEDRKKILDARKDDINNKTIQLENAVNAEKVTPYIDAVQRLEKTIQDDTFNLESLNKKVSILKQELTILEKKYEEAYKLKEEKKPKLDEEKNKLKVAIEIEKELENINTYLNDLKIKGLELNQKKDTKSKVILELEANRTSILKSLKELETSIEKLKISADLKQNIFKAYELEKEYEKLNLEKNNKSTKIKDINIILDEAKLKSKYIQRDKDIILKKVQDLDNEYNLLINKSPGTNKDILIKSEQLNELRSKSSKIKELEDKKKSLKNELNEILESKHLFQRELNTLTSNLENIDKDIIDLDKEVDRLKYLNLAKELRKELKENSPCPVCGSRDHAKLDTDSKEDELNFVKSKLEKQKQKQQEINVKLDDVKNKYNQCMSIETIKNKELDEVISKIGDSKSVEINKIIEEQSKLLEVLKVNVENWEKNKQETELKISKHKEEKSNIEKDEVQNNHIVETSNSTLKELNKEYEVLDSKLTSLKNDYIGMKTKVKINNLSEKVKEINENEKVLEELGNKYNEKMSQRNSLEEDLKIKQDEIHQIDRTLIEEREKYSQNKKIRDEKHNELISLTKGNKASALLEEIENEINKILKDEEIIKNKMDGEKSELDKLLQEKHRVEGSISVSTEQLKEQNKTLNQLLIDNKFENIYAVKRSLLDKGYIMQIKNEISEYDEETKIINVGLKDLKDKLAGRRVDKEDFDKLKQDIHNVKVEISTLAQEKGSKQTIIENLKSSLENIKSISKEKKIVENKLSLLDELDKSVQGNRFVEYVATNQLKYIALEASKRLDDITKGRYALEIDSTLNFVMRDNFNGGERRSVDTLSGGETFLTSLSLALALSSQIQLKGNAPLEFFFLDEGFGSLDSDLLEIVIESLERLHNDKLSVGIITHVEELKSRVPVKLIVNPSNISKGSTVKIEYS